MIMGCSSSPRYTTGSTPSRSKSTKKINSTSASSKNGKVKHRKVMTGVSSFYAEDFHGKLTANGEVFDMNAMTAAHKTLPLGTLARITNLENDNNLILRINDRGPYVGDRILDCSYGAAKKLDFIIKSPPASHFIKEAAKLKGGSQEPGRQIVASITKKQAEEIAKKKMSDLNAHDLEQAVKIIKGSARSMGIEVKD